jgi:Glycosyl transferases group 1
MAKKTDVFFAGGTAHRLNRQWGLRQLERLKAEGYSIDIVQEQLPLDEFLRRCAQACLVWSPEGHGWDCQRHYEAAVTGSVPLMQSPTIYRHAPLLDNEHGIYYHVEGDHLAFRIRQALQNRVRLTEMGQAARAHVLRWHTHAALGRYVIEETRRTLSGTSEFDQSQ